MTATRLAADGLDRSTSSWRRSRARNLPPQTARSGRHQRVASRAEEVRGMQPSGDVQAHAQPAMAAATAETLSIKIRTHLWTPGPGSR